MPTAPPTVRDFKDDLAKNYSPAQLLDRLDNTIPDSFKDTGVHAAATVYVWAIGDSFYYSASPAVERQPLPALPVPLPPVLDGERLNEADRERCLIALLASRGRTFELAVHIYIAIMAGVSEAEIRHVLFLSGVYAGTDSLNASLIVLGRTLRVLSGIAKDHPTGDRVIGALLYEFASSPTDVAKQIGAELEALREQLKLHATLLKELMPARVQT